jgi:hypothetical protein
MLFACLNSSLLMPSGPDARPFSRALSTVSTSAASVGNGPGHLKMDVRAHLRWPVPIKCSSEF